MRVSSESGRKSKSTGAWGWWALKRIRRGSRGPWTCGHGVWAHPVWPSAGLGVFPEREGKALVHFDGGVPQPGCCGQHRMQAGLRWSHGSVRGSCRPRGEGGLGEDGLSRWRETAAFCPYFKGQESSRCLADGQGWSSMCSIKLDTVCVYEEVVVLLCFFLSVCQTHTE